MAEDEKTEFKVFIGCPREQPIEEGGGLGSETTDQELEDYFTQFGDVVEVIQLQWQKSGNKKGCGYIKFTNMEAVDECVKMGEHTIGGRAIVSSKAKPREELKQREDRDHRDVNRKRGNPMERDRERGVQKRPRMDVEDINLEAKIMRKLFIAGFPIGTTEEELTAYFQNFGAVESCVIAKTKTGEAKNYCFMVFEKAAGVDAVQIARPHTIEEKEITTKRSALEEDKQNNNIDCKKIFIGSPNNFTFQPGTGGLNEDISDDDLKDYFGQFGVVTQVMQLFHKDTGRKKGVGFVYFEDEDSVDKIVLIGAHIIKERVFEAQKAQTESFLTGNHNLEKRQQVDPKSRAMRRIFVRGLTEGTTVEKLKDYFGQFGEITDSDIPDNKTRRKAVFGFITFDTMEQVDECMKARPHTMDEKEVIVKRAMSKESPELSSCLKVFLGSPGGRTTSTGGLNDTVSDDDLREYFGKFGILTNVKQIRDKNTDRHKGVAFVEYEDTDSVDKVVLLSIHEIKDRQIEATKALTDQQRREQDLREREKRMEKMERGMGYGGRGERGYGGRRDERDDRGPSRSRDDGYSRDRRDRRDYEDRDHRRYGGRDEREMSDRYGGGRSMGGRRDYDDYDDRGPRRGYQSRERGRYQDEDDFRRMDRREDDYRRGGRMDMMERNLIDDRRERSRGMDPRMGGSGMDMMEREFMMGGGHNMGSGGGMGGMGYMGGSGGMDMQGRESMQGGMRSDGPVPLMGGMGGSGGMGSMGPMGGSGGMGPMGGSGGMGPMGGAGGMGPMGSAGGMGSMGGTGGNAASQGRKLLVDGLTSYMSDQTLSKYFQKFGELVDWGRDKAGGGYVVFVDPHGADYCVRRQNHQIEGNEIFVVKANSS